MARDDQNKNDNSENKDRAKAAVEFALTGMLQNMSMKMCDDFVDKNASLASKAGLVAILIRETHGTPCEFCAELAGRYDYESRPSGVRSRHKGCNCTVEFKTERKDSGIEKKKAKEAKEKRINYDQKKPEENYKKILGSHDVDDDVKAANPHYSEGLKYQDNCQRCVWAYEMRRRGYDVEALPSLTNSDTLPYMMNPRGWPEVIKNGRNELIIPEGRTGKAIKKNIENQMEEWGDGSRAIVRVRWQKGDSGHVFIAEQVDGKTRFVDPQSGEKDVTYYFNSGNIKASRTRLLRTDKKDITELIDKAVKNK